MMPTIDTGAGLLLAASLTWIEIALLMFFTIFIGIVVWLAAARRGKFDEAARIPLDDDVVTPRPNDLSSQKQ